MLGGTARGGDECASLSPIHHSIQHTLEWLVPKFQGKRGRTFQGTQRDRILRGGGKGGVAPFGRREDEFVGVKRCRRMVLKAAHVWCVKPATPPRVSVLK